MPRPHKKMPGPHKKIPAHHKLGDPFRSLLSSLNIQQRNTVKQAALMISKQVDECTLKLTDELLSVDFIHSNLPAHVLNDRRDEEVLPQICSLEWNTRALIPLLQNDRQTIIMDIRPIDEQLMILVLMFKQFVAHGDVMAAKMAMDALYCGIHDIRCKLPLSQPDLADAFVRANAAYLRKWVILVELAQRYDRTTAYLDTEKAAAQDARDEHEKQLDAFETRIRNDPEFLKAFHTLAAVPPHAPADWWTPAMREAYHFMTAFKVIETAMGHHDLYITALNNELTMLRQQLNALRTSLNQLPIVADPMLMDKYQDATDQFICGVAAFDRHTEKISCMTDSIYGPDYFTVNPLATEAAKMQEAQMGMAETDRIHHRQELEEMTVAELSKELFGEERLQRILNPSDNSNN